MRLLGLAVSFGFGVMPSAAVHADEVPSVPPPTSFEARSPNGKCVAYVDASASRITGARLDDGGRREIWVIPEHQQAIRLADDCQSAMALYPGHFALMEQDHQPSTVVLSFFRSGKPVGHVRLGEVYSNIDTLPRSVSHWRWAKAAGWEDGKWLIRTVDDREILFDPASGQRIDPSPSFR